MNKVLTSVILGLTFIIPSYAEETMSYEEAFLQTIHICKDKSLYKEAKKNFIIISHNPSEKEWGVEDHHHHSSN